MLFWNKSVSGKYCFTFTNEIVTNINATIAAQRPCFMNVFKKGFMMNPSVAPTSCMLLTMNRLEYTERRIV